MVTPEDLAAACPDRESFVVENGEYKVTIIVDVDFSYQDARRSAEFEAARQIAAHFNPSIPTNQVRYQSESPTGYYVGPPGQPGVRIRGLGAIMREVPASGGDLYQCQSPRAYATSTGKFIGSYSAPEAGVTNVAAVPGGEGTPAGEDPSESAPAGDTSQSTTPATPDPGFPPGVEEVDGNYIVTVLVPSGENAEDLAKDELAKYVTSAPNARGSNLGFDKDLTELSSSPANVGSVTGKRVLIMGDSQWDGTSMGNAVRDKFIAQGADVRTLYKYGKGLAVSTSYWGVEIGNSGAVTVNPPPEE